MADRAGLFEIKVHELRKLPSINLSQLTEKEEIRIRKAFLEYCDAQEIKDPKKIEEAKEELDNAIFDAFNLSQNERKQVYEGLESLRNMRISGKKVEVLVETAEEWKPERRRKIVEEEPTR